MKTQHLFTHDVRPGHLFRIPDCPDNVMLDLTWRCNYQCSFCYNPAENRRQGDPPWEVTEAILRKLALWGVREILYLGGEPLLHSRFDDVVRLGADLGLIQRVVTNGSLISEERARLLAALRVEVGVSLHSADAAIHNCLTGARNAFAKTLQGLDYLVAAGVGTFVQYSPTRLDPNGLEYLAAFLTDRYPKAIRFIDVNRLLPFGEGAVDRDNVVPDADRWWEVLRSVGRLVLSGWSVRVESFPHCWVRERASADQLSDVGTEGILRSLRPCYMGINQLALNAGGAVKLCPGGTGFEQLVILHDPRSVWCTHPALLEFREFRFLNGECVDYSNGLVCRRFYCCLGGCRLTSGCPAGSRDSFALSRTTGRLEWHHSSRR